MNGSQVRQKGELGIPPARLPRVGKEEGER